MEEYVENEDPEARYAQTAVPNTGTISIVVSTVREPVYEWFQKQRPPNFDVNPNIAVLKGLFRKVQHIFSYMQLSEARMSRKSIRERSYMLLGTLCTSIST